MAVSKPLVKELGDALQALRSKAGLSQRALEQRVGISDSKISLWESGQRLPPLDDLERVLDELNVPADERERLLAIRREAEGPGELVAGPTTIGAQLTKLIEKEEAASRVVEVAPLLVPGLLQTADYAKAILGHLPDASTRIALRVGRARILTRSPDPVEFQALIDDEVLVRHIAPPNVMAEQMRHLLRMAERPNITIQLVHSTHVGYTPLLAGPFILLEFESAPPLVHLEHYRASASLWEEGDVRSFTAAVEQITNAAMTPERTSEVIEELVNGMETKT